MENYEINMKSLTQTGAKTGLTTSAPRGDLCFSIWGTQQRWWPPHHTTQTGAGALEGDSTVFVEDVFTFFHFQE